MRFALIISIMLSLSLSAYGQEYHQTPSPTASPTLAAPVTTSTPDPMDPKFEAYYPRNGVEAEMKNPGGEWYRDPYGRMHYHPPNRKHVGATTATNTTTPHQATTTDTTATTTSTHKHGHRQCQCDSKRGASKRLVRHNPPAVTPKKTSKPWNLGWLWSSLQFLGCLGLIALIAWGVWAVGNRWGAPAAGTMGITVIILGVLLWLAS